MFGVKVVLFFISNSGIESVNTKPIFNYIILKIITGLEESFILTLINF